MFDWQSGGRVLDPLKARERDVLVMISQGDSNRQIARALEISPEIEKLARQRRHGTASAARNHT